MIDLLPLTSDFTFKNVFGQEKGKACLISLLNAILEDKPHIFDVTLKNVELIKQAKDSPNMRLDIKADIGNDMFVDIEMQYKNTGEIYDRAIHYAAGMLMENFKKSEDKGRIDYRKPKVISIWILGEVLDQEREFPVNQAYITLQETKKDGYKVMSDKMRFVFIELPKFSFEKKELNDKLNEWIEFIKNPNREDLHKIQEIEQAYEILEEMSTDDEARQVYQARREAEEAKYSELNVKTELAREEGIAQGIEKGIAQGIEKGREEGAKEEKIAMAKKMLSKSYSIEDIVDMTGLSKEEIEKIK